jgi:hypothetical protein
MSCQAPVTEKSGRLDPDDESPAISLETSAKSPEGDMIQESFGDTAMAMETCGQRFAEHARHFDLARQCQHPQRVERRGVGLLTTP